MRIHIFGPSGLFCSRLLLRRSTLNDISGNNFRHYHSFIVFLHSLCFLIKIILLAKSEHRNCLFFYSRVLKGGIKCFSSWEPILSAQNFSQDRGCQTQVKLEVVVEVRSWRSTGWSWVAKIAVLLVFDVWSTWNFFTWQEMLSCENKCIPVTRIFLLWQEVISIDK